MLEMRGVFQLHIDVVSPPYLHNFGLELFQLRELKGWNATRGLLKKKMWGGGCPKVGLKAIGCQISLQVEGVLFFAFVFMVPRSICIWRSDCV